MRNKWLVVGTLAIVVVLIVVVFMNNSSNVDEDVATEYDAPPNVEGQPYLGDTEAPVTVVAFGDYKCPSCKAWDETVFPELKETFIDEGIVQFIHVNTPFHGEESMLAAQASESIWNQNQEAFWTFHEAIYQNQPETQQHDEQWVTEETLLDIASSLDENISLENLEEDLQNQAFQEQIREDIDLVEQFEVAQTPTIMVNQYKLTNPFHYEQIVMLIEQENAE
ncbi:DsbA family protein [Alkalihalobacillus sp. LMS6]|uniref:DsbA family protein n=1 Tax=Bacillaceae TaxID=186817 RepID=UPI000C083CAB|nr:MULTISPECIES: DsbA family protein [Bacillaceae]UTR07219.1 DsbA family protein [Alkalihalobacillus sp. LMS6]